MKRITNQNLFLIFLILIITIITVTNWIWIGLNQVPIFYDTAGHTNLAFIYTNIIKGVFPLHGLKELLQVSTYYPPFMYLLGSFIPLVFGDNYKNLQIFSTLFLPLSAFALFLFTNKITANRRICLFTVSFFVLFPHVWEQSRYFMLDLPLTTFILFALYFLLQSQGLKNAKYSFLFFIMVGIAQLTKWYAFIYLLIPVTFIFIELIKEKQKIIWENIIKGIGIVLLITFPWYIANISSLIQSASIYSQPDFGDPVSKISVTNLGFYFVLLANFQIVSIQLIWLLLSFPLVILSKAKYGLLLVLNILFIYLFFSLIGNKNLRYLMPLLPFLAIIMGWGLEIAYRSKPNIGKIIFLVIIALGISVYSINSFRWPINTELLITYKISPGLESLNLLDLSSKSIPYAYQKTDWSPAIIVNDLKDNHDEKHILVIANYPLLSVATLNVYSLLKAPYIFFDETPVNSENIFNDPVNTEIYLKKFDYLLITKTEFAPVGQSNFNTLAKFHDYILSGQTRNFTLIKTYQISEDNQLYLLKYDPQNNLIQINIRGDYLSIERKPAIANIYLQFMNKDNQWTQEVIDQNQIIYEKNLAEIKTVRVDYPTPLWVIGTLENWKWNSEKQLDRVIPIE